MPFILVNTVEENMSQKIALDALRLAEKTLNSLNGMTKTAATRFVNDLIHPR
jgi:Tfp pilus assembly protein PilX